jgi:translation initiation factor 2 subunit 3
MITIKLSDVIKRQPIINIGTIGHVSHGKSTVVLALTGKKTQEHSAEQVRNITINLGYANTKIWYNKDTDEFKTTNSDIELDENEWQLVQHFSFVDCPGHNAYLSTMISGAGAMNGVMLVISGSDDIFPQPQTIEHMTVINKLKISNMVVLQNKLDIINEERAVKNKDDIREFLQGSPYAEKPIIPISASNRLNTDSVIRWLTQQKPTDLKIDTNRIVFNIIRSFDINKPYTPFDEIKGGVVGGTLKEGILTVGDYVEIKPGFMVNGKPKKLYAKVLEIYSEKNKLEYAIPGGLIAVQLDIDPYLTKNNRMVGQIMGYNIDDYKVYQKMELKIKTLKPDISYDKLSKNDKVYINVNSRTVEANIDKIKDRKVMLTAKNPIVINEDSKISIITINDKEINCDFYGSVKDGEEIECEYDEENKKIYDEYKLPKYELIDDLDEKEFNFEFNYEELLENIKFKDVQQKHTRFIVPEVTFKNKYSQITNFTKCVENLYRSYPKETGNKDILTESELKQHLIDYIKEEIMADVSENNFGLRFRAKFNTNKFFPIYQGYMTKHYMCSNCKNYDCYLIKLKRNINKLCNFCNKVEV